MARRNLLLYFIRNLAIVLSLVLIWRGIWYSLDGVDRVFFNNSHALTAVGGIIIGIILLYLPDKDLKEIEKL